MLLCALEPKLFPYELNFDFWKKYIKSETKLKNQLLLNKPELLLKKCATFKMDQLP